jgi:hypothetical protein
MNLKNNLNKIHGDLLNKFNNVEIYEKSDLNIGNYIEFSINENNREIRAIITKRELENNSFNWVYFSNPLEKNSPLVERKSSIDGFLSDIIDIFEKVRFDSGYINNNI